MFETLLRPMDVTSTPSLPSINDVTARLKAAEVKREDKRLRQIAQNREREAKEAKEAFAKAQNEGEVLGSSVKRKQDDDDEAKGGDEGEVEKKRVKTSNGVGEMQVDGDRPAVPVISTTQITLSQVLGPTSTSTSLPAASSTPALPSATPTPAPTAPAPVPSTSSKPPAGKISVSKALPEVRGHTSYLTFATLVPYAYAQKLMSKGGEAAQASRGTAKKNRAAEAEAPQSENRDLEAAVPGFNGSASVSHATSAEPEEKAMGSA
jgi:tRNA (adenine57-N1/adenine58-N1)-methyltransferase